jgi:hypothetical protein
MCSDRREVRHVKRFVIALSFVFLFALAAAGYAQTGGQGWNYCPYCGQGMMGGGYGMGPGMMGGYGGGMGPGMMRGYGGGMGPGMMRGYGGGMGPGMMGPGYGQSEECQKFLDETAGLRKELYNKRYEYFEAYRNPKTSPETVVKLEKEIRELQEKMHAKGPGTYQCPW